MQLRSETSFCRLTFVLILIQSWPKRVKDYGANDPGASKLS